MFATNDLPPRRLPSACLLPGDGTAENGARLVFHNHVPTGNDSGMGGGFDGAFHRPPRAYPQPVPADELVLQPPPQSFAGPPQSLLFALFPVVGGLGIFAFALVYHNPLFLLIAGAMVTVTILFGVLMYWSQRRQGKQSARRRRRRYREYLAGQERRLAEVAALQRAAGERLSPDLQD